jgi:D-alanyl-D-alanine endopeptidase (penicillin-binding protein 7)
MLSSKMHRWIKYPFVNVLLYVIIKIFSKYFMKKFLIFLIIGLFFNAVDASSKKSSHRYTVPEVTYALWNLDSGEFITSKNQQEVRPIASITKLMSVLVILRENLDLEEEITVVGKEESSRIRAGMKIARRTLIELALISSDNLATRTLAESYPGGYQKFIIEMNNVAQELGMVHTKYADSTGLLSNNISSAEDIRKLVLAVSPFNIITNAANTARLAFKTSVTNKNKVKEVRIQANNTNSFVGKLDIIAAKTGFTSRAGRCLTMMFRHNGSNYLLVIMGAQTSEQRKKIVESLLVSTK